MLITRKYIIFSLIGIGAILPITSQAKDNLFNLAEQIFKAGQTTQKFDNPEQSNNGQPTSSSRNLKSPGLCPQHYPLGAPVVVSVEKEKVERRSFYLCEDNYAVQFDPATKTPLWVSERLVGAEQSNTYVERVDNFQSNPIVPKPAQASLNDYRGSKFDRGHMAPAADMLTENAMAQSFFLTNMIPQVGPNMNRGIWAEIENMARKWSGSRGEVLVVTGPIFSQGYATIGKSQVWVPTHVYKVVLDPRTAESIAFIIPNVQIVTRKTKNLDEGNPEFPQTTPQAAVNCGRTCIIDNFIVPLTSVEQATGIFFFPKLNPQQKQQASQKGRMWSVKH